MNHLKIGLDRIWPVAALGIMAIGSLLMGTTAGADDNANRQTSTIEVIVTSDMWRTFYPTGPANDAQIASLRSNLKAATGDKKNQLILDTGGFSGMTMLTETDYRPGAIGVFADFAYNAVNLGQQESLLLPVEVEMLLKRASDAGVKPFVSSFNTNETTYDPLWSPYVEVKSKGVPLLIGGISRDIQNQLFATPSAMFSGIDNAAYTRQLVENAKKIGAFPILLADADDATIDALAKDAGDLPLIIGSSLGGSNNTRTIGNTLIVNRQAHNAVESFTLRASLADGKAAIENYKSLAIEGSGETGEKKFWPESAAKSAAWPATAWPDIGLPLDNPKWLNTMGLNSETLDMNILTAGELKSIPTDSSTMTYYNVNKKDDTEVKRLVYIRHLLPRPYPNIYFLVLADSSNKIEQLYFPFGVILGSRFATLEQWAQTMTGDDSKALEAKLADPDLNYFQALLMADIYHTLKALEAGAI